MATQSEHDQHVQLSRLVEQFAATLVERRCSIATVESCTGGGVAAAFTDLAGSSMWFDRGFVTYSNSAKIEMVGVSPSVLAEHGAVSEAVAREMAVGGLKHSHADYALAITGIAGPGGATQGKPVGTVCFAWAGFTEQTVAATQHFSGDRRSVRIQSVIYAIEQALYQMRGNI